MAFSIICEDHTIDMEAPTASDRAKWVFALRLLVGGLIVAERRLSPDSQVVAESRIF